jgi:hypothetical protein
MRARTLALGATLASAVTVLALAQPSVADDASAAPAAGPVAWSASHGQATASGTRWTEPGEVLFPKLVIEGTLDNNGTGCSSVWVQWTHDFVVYPPKKVVTQCGGGSKAVNETLASYSPTMTGRLTVCAGKADTSDCGAWESLTSWPVGQGR